MRFIVIIALLLTISLGFVVGIGHLKGYSRLKQDQLVEFCLKADAKARASHK
jgi:hypothetical protein